MNYCVFYLKHGGERVRVLTLEDEVFIGFLEDYTSAVDNEPDPESITVGDVEIYTSDIKKIELLQ